MGHLERSGFERGQLVHVLGSPAREFGLYVQPPPDTGREDGFILYYHRDCPDLPGEGWFLSPLELLLRRVTLTPWEGCLVEPEVERGLFHVWMLPPQRFAPGITLGWAPDPRDPRQGSWACAEDQPGLHPDCPWIQRWPTLPWLIASAPARSPGGDAAGGPRG